MQLPLTNSPATNVNPATTYTIMEISARAAQLVQSRQLLAVPIAHMTRPKITSSVTAAPIPTI
jgi:hypothetical protein